MATTERHDHVSLRTVYWVFVLSLLTSIASATLLLQPLRRYDDLFGMFALAGYLLFLVLMLRRDVRRLFGLR